MKLEETKLKDCFILRPNVFEDERGYFFESFNSNRFKDVTGIDFQVKQINQSGSSKGVLRGLHFQKSPKAQAKLISCIEGEVIDIAVDLRNDSPTYGHYEKVRLSHENKKQLYIPRGMAHGFLVVSNYAEIMYQVDQWYSPEHDTGIYFNDPEIGIDWEMSQEEIILSEKDKKLPTLKKADIQFDYV